MVVHTIVSVVDTLFRKEGLRELRMPDTKQRGTQHIRTEVLVYRPKISEPTPRT